MTTLPTQIHARVSQRGLRIAPQLFQRDTNELVAELVQNSRRAHASHLRITLEQLPRAESGTSRLAVRWEDNGQGVDDPQSLITLWDTGWDEGLQQAEEPAGAGFYALSTSEDGVRVTSHDWCVHLTPAVFAGEVSADVVTTDTPVAGTRLEFCRHDVLMSAFTNAIERAVQYAPIARVELTSGESTKTLPSAENFLEAADIVREWPDMRVGLQFYRKRWEDREKPDYWSRFHDHNSRSQCSFHGRRLSGPAPFMTGEAAWRIDILNASAADFVLPTRDRIAETPKRQQLIDRLNQVMIEDVLLQHYAGKHRLSFDIWSVWHQQYPQLPEAVARVGVATHEDPLMARSDLGCDLPDWAGWWKQGVPQPDRRENFSVDLEPGEMFVNATRQEASLLALACAELPCWLFVGNHHRRFWEGYSWWQPKYCRVIQEVEDEEGKRHTVEELRLAKSQRHTWPHTWVRFVVYDAPATAHDEDSDMTDVPLLWEGSWETPVAVDTERRIEGVYWMDAFVHLSTNPEMREFIDGTLLRAVALDIDLDTEDSESITTEFDASARTWLLSLFASPEEAARQLLLRQVASGDLAALVEVCAFESATITFARNGQVCGVTFAPRGAPETESP